MGSITIYHDLTNLNNGIKGLYPLVSEAIPKRIFKTGQMHKIVDTHYRPQTWPQQGSPPLLENNRIHKIYRTDAILQIIQVSP